MLFFLKTKPISLFISIMICKLIKNVVFQVSWIRKSSLHVLTSNVITFTGDSRFSCLHTALSDTWTLQIKYTQLRDRGEYQCQVNTEPKISMSVFLSVTGCFLFLSNVYIIQHFQYPLIQTFYKLNINNT